MGVKKMSMHQTGFQEVLMSARLITGNPRRIALIGVQPQLLDDYGGSLRDITRERLPAALALALGVLEEWGVAVNERDEPLLAAELTGPAELEMSSYENRWPQ
jgi:hydrogenase maturation protease